MIDKLLLWISPELGDNVLNGPYDDFEDYFLIFFWVLFQTSPWNRDFRAAELHSPGHLGTVPATPEALHLIREAWRFPACDVTFPKFHGFYMTVGHTHHATILLLFDPLPFHVGQMSVFVSGKYHDWFVHAICSGAIPNFCWVYRCIAIFSRLNQSFCCVKPGRTRQPQHSASCFGHFQLCRGVFFFFGLLHEKDLHDLTSITTTFTKRSRTNSGGWIDRPSKKRSDATLAYSCYGMQTHAYMRAIPAFKLWSSPPHLLWHILCFANIAMLQTLNRSQDKTS